MNTKKLKQLVLDLAIHGKLVPQDPNDEPASELLKRIVETHGRASNIGRASNKKSAISSDKIDEVPFDVPKGWVWTTIGGISSNILYGVNESAKDSGKYKLLRITDIQDNKVDWNSVPYTNYDEKKVCDYLLKKNDILFARTGATVGKSFLVEDEVSNCIYASYLIKVQTNELLDSKYIKRFFESAYYWSQISDNSIGTGQPNVNGTLLASLRIPLPPLSEQKRIVAEIEKWFGIIDQLESNEADLRKSIEQTKRKVLDLAIHGKLVPQDPNDEPASELLKRIVETHGRASNIGRASNKSKGKKSAISSDNLDDVPFEVPKGWVWTILGSYLDVRDGTHDSPKYVDASEGIPFVTSKNLKDGTIDFSSIQYISIEDHKSFSQRSFVENDDILFAMIGSIGNPVLVKKDREFSIKNVALFKSSQSENHNMKYVFFFLQYIQYDLREKAKGGMQPFIPLGYFRNELLIPLPPLSEQRRIVAKIEEVFGELDRIEEMIG